MSKNYAAKLLEKKFDTKWVEILTWMALKSLRSCLDFGPGIVVFNVGPSGSPGTKALAYLAGKQVAIYLTNKKCTLLNEIYVNKCLLLN